MKLPTNKRKISQHMNIDIFINNPCMDQRTSPKENWEKKKNHKTEGIYYISNLRCTLKQC